MTSPEAERRAYFRIDDAVQCRYRVVSPEDRARRAEAIEQGLESDFTVVSNLATVGQQAALLLRRIESRDPDVAEYLSLLERKIDLLARAFIAHDTDLASCAAMPVNLSAGGVAIRTAEAHAPGTLLELHLLLLPGMQGVICHGEVVTSEALEQADGDYAYLTRLSYRLLREEDRDILIRHILRKQGEMLRRSRRVRESDE